MEAFFEAVEEFIAFDRVPTGGSNSRRYASIHGHTLNAMSGCMAVLSLD
jgi:hypothetical protein